MLGILMVLFAFVCLQVMDTLTTLLFLHHGVREANPLIKAALATSADPRMALGVSKVLAIALAIFAWHSGRRSLLRKVNVLYLACVAWNLAAACVR